MTAPLDLDTLELLADIQEDLRNQIARRRLRTETIDADTPIDDLVGAGEEFKRMVAVLTWRSP